MHTGDKSVTSLAAILLALGLGACEQQGPAERAGEQLDKEIEDAKQALDPQGPAARAGEKLDEAVQRAKDKTQ